MKSTTLHTALLLIFVRATHKTPSATLKKETITTTHKLALAARTSVAGSLLILTLHFLKSDNSSRLLVHDGSETSLTFHDDVEDAHLAAQGGEEDDELDGVDVVRDDEGDFLGFNEGHDVVEAVFD